MSYTSTSRSQAMRTFSFEFLEVFLYKQIKLNIMPAEGICVFLNRRTASEHLASSLLQSGVKRQNAHTVHSDARKIKSRREYA